MESDVIIPTALHSRPLYTVHVLIKVLMIGNALHFYNICPF